LPCSDCVLSRLVPPEQRGGHFPCRFIPLNEAGETIEDFYQHSNEQELQKALKAWLQKTIHRLEEEGRERRVAWLDGGETAVSPGSQPHAGPSKPGVFATASAEGGRI